MFKKIKNDWSKLKGVAKVFKEYYGLGFVLIFFSLISGILEGIGITAIIPLFAFLDSNQQGTDFLSQSIAAFMRLWDVPYTLKTFLIFISGVFVIKAAFLLVATYLTAYIAANFEERTRNRLMLQTLQADWSFLSKQKIGHLDQLLTTSINYSSALLTYLLSAVVLTVNLVIYTLLVFNISAVIALCTFIFGTIVIFVFKPFFKRGRSSSYKVSLMFKTLAHYVNENILGMKTIKSLAVEQSVVARTHGFFEQIKKHNIRIAWFKNITNVLLQPAGLLFVLGIFSYFYKQSLFTFASFAVIIYAINKIFSLIQQLQTQFHTINANLPYLTGIVNYGNELSQHLETRIGQKAFVFKETLAFNKVSFAYSPEKVVAKDISFVVKRGDMVGIVGPSGSGKTTIADLLLQLYTPHTGTITVDGVSIADIQITEWRKSVGYVSQDMFLMNESIANNIRFYDAEISDEQMFAAAKTAEIFETIMSLPHGFDTVIGERGVLLSSGQRQRIVLARALARNPKILILDEATSALDNESESLIQKSIEDLRGHITVIAIAHRLSTIINFDQIVVVENGEVLESGPPQTLLADKNSYFHRVYFLKK